MLLVLMFAILLTLAFVFGALSLLVWIIDPGGGETAPLEYGCTGQHGCDRCPRRDGRHC